MQPPFMFALLDLCLFLWIDQQCPLVCLGDACCWYLGRQNLPSVAVFFDDHIEVMVYSNQYQLDPKTATRPLEDDQPLGAVTSLRVILPFLHTQLIASNRPSPDRRACGRSGGHAASCGDILTLKWPSQPPIPACLPTNVY
jgi:hypothetical protein